MTCLLAGNVTAGSRHKVASGFAGTKLDAQRHATKLPFVELPAWGVALAHVTLCAYASGGENSDKAFDLSVEFLALLIGGLGGDTDGDNDSLGFCDARGQNQATVVTVDHDHYTQSTGRETPGVLPDVEGRFLLVALG